MWKAPHDSVFVKTRTSVRTRQGQEWSRHRDKTATRKELEQGVKEGAGPAQYHLIV